MPVEFLENEAIADIAFRIKSSTLQDLFEEACHTIFSLQTDIELLEENMVFEFEVDGSSYERLLYNLLSEILFFRDSEIFFAKYVKLSISNNGENFHAKGKFVGDEINDKKYTMGNDIKAITMHDFYLKEVKNGWESYVLVDI